MDNLDDLPEVPADPDPLKSGNATGGYAAGSDDEEIAKINRRVSPLGKALVVLVLGLLGGTGYFLLQSARAEQAEESAQRNARHDLEQLLGQNLPNDQLASRVREVYERYKVSPEARMSSRRLLAHLRDAQSVSLMLEGLRNPGSPRERQQAALALAELGSPAADSAKDALLEVLPRTDPLVDRVEVAWALVVLGEGRAWSTIVDLLGSGKLQTVRNLDDPPRPIFDPGLVARMAGPTNLIQLAADTRPVLRRIAAKSLAELATPQVYDTLATLSRDSDADTSQEAAIGLGRTGDPRAGQPIVEYLNRHPDARDSVLNALQRFSGSTGLSVVIRSATDPTTRATAVRLLQELQDPGAADAFMHVLSVVPATATSDQERTMRRNAIFGLADIGDERAAEGLIEIVQRPLQPGVAANPNLDQDARLALEALRKISGAPARAKPQLLAILANQASAFMHTPLLIALGMSGDAAVGAQAMRFLANPDSQEGAAIAVCHLRYGPGIARVRADMVRPRNLIMSEETVEHEQVFIKRRNAIRAITWSRDPQYAADLMRIVEDRQDRRLLREEAGLALSAIADDRVLQQIVTKATAPDTADDVRAYYIAGLRGRSTPQISAQLVNSFLRPGTAGPVMRTAAIAAGFGGTAETAEALRPMLTSTDATVRLAAAIAATLSGDHSTATDLIAALGNETYGQELTELLRNTFVTRAGGGAANTAVASEPAELMPLTEAMFDDGRIYRRIDLALAMERGRGANHYDYASLWLRTRLRAGWQHPLGIGTFEVRAKLRQAAAGTDEFRREMAFRIMRVMNDRGSLLALRRGTGPSAEQARRILVEMNAQN